MIPPQAVFEAELFPGVAIWDVSHLLPSHPTKGYGHRTVDEIDVVFVHHSGADGPRGFRGVLASARYVTGHRGWPGAAYHLWFPFHPERDHEGRLVIYRAQSDEVLCYHTGGANRRGVGWALQGNLTNKPPSPSQIECLEAAIPWWMDANGLKPRDALSMHEEADRFGGRPRPTCPGPHAARWVREYRIQT